MQARATLALTATLLAFAPLGAPLVGQEWQDRTRPGPSARYDHAMTWDSLRGVGVLFGGFEHRADRHFGDTWEYDGSAWSRVAVGGPAPAARKRHAMCFDAGRGVVVLFGGLIANSLHTNARYLGDTWEFDGTTWRLVQVPGPTPDPRTTDIAYDAARGVVVLVGGVSRTGYYRDIWEYDGTTWTERGSTLLPRSRPGHEIAYDSARGVTVIEPRFQYGQSGPWQTSEWDGTTLRLATYTNSGPHFPSGDLSYDSRRGVVVAVGTWFTGTAQTWEYDGTDWHARTATTGQEALGNHSLVFADTLGSLVLFGGEKARGLFLIPTAETFEFAEFAAVTPVGTPCSRGSTAAPDLRPVGGSLPASGTTFELETTPLQPTDSALLLVGLRNDRWAGMPLPFALGSIGLPGCSLRVAPEIARPMPGGGPFRLPIPASTSLHGGALHLQALVSDGSLQPRGVTQALTATVGR